MSKGTPQPGRLIRCKGFDWSPFECVGKWVLYKGQTTGRFMRQGKFGIWMADRKTWQDVESWEYLDEPNAEGRES